ncbi:MAG: FAD-binding oxidoreductase [Bacteroidetes bacterium HGW-Bacteroidetes-21]|nr:MAG: FAD-binding oxidoreductase [Bacteroidetes bacterium HGW-Bacteroidetes-21]
MEMQLDSLRTSFKGEIHTSLSHRLMYATDASAYREMPLGVVLPKSNDDIQAVVKWATKNKISLIPRTAGTSLAGQVVGAGLVVDVSKYMTEIIEINKAESWVKVQPGVVLDELNKELAKHDLFFGPETSTSSRCMIGGMVGNNSCGAHSLIYGSTRDHTLEIRAFLSDGSEVVFGNLSREEFAAKCELLTKEGDVYRNIQKILTNDTNRKEITENYPHPEIERRNTGYAFDLLLNTEPFGGDKSFNFCKLLAGSEGTLAFFTEIKLNLVPLPPKEVLLLCIHTHTLKEAFTANLVALKYQPASIELMDGTILELTKGNIEQNKNRFFIEGNPEGILIVEFVGTDRASLDKICDVLEQDLKSQNMGYHYPRVYNADAKKVWNLRKAGLGVLSNMPGDAKPVSLIEDTAVRPVDLPAYMEDFSAMLKKYHLDCVYYAHIATGELHLKPILNLKDPAHVELFHTVALDTAKLVKKYRGSLSGEHGDGRLRGEFIPLMLGDHCYALIQEIKKTWDPDNIFNPKKIVDTPAMNSFLRFEPGANVPEPETLFDFSKDGGMLRTVEKCNGSGDCRKTEIIGGTMCPSYQASRNENQTTRARANILREFLTHSNKKNRFDHQEIYQIMDLCLSCKACKSECPSSVDVAKLKAEFLQHYYDAHHIPLRVKAIAYISSLNKLGMIWPGMTNFFFKNSFTSGIAKSILGFAPKRKIPLVHKQTLRKYYKSLQPTKDAHKKVYLFADEFTNYNDTEIGIKAILLLNKLGYEVVIPAHKVSGRTFISKGLIRTAKKIARFNVEALSEIISHETPLIGIEPSAILTFRDEYPDLVGKDLKEKAIQLSKNCLMFDEFIVQEADAGRINPAMFTDAPLEMKLHGHCQQKAIASTATTKKMLTLPVNYQISEIPSGCCGMAGSFGYEKEHYDLSMKIGELILFPAVRKLENNITVVASGTSCRCQIEDGTGKKALHPVEVMWNALKKN